MQVVRAPGTAPGAQVAHLLASELAGLICLLATASDPLSLSLGAPAARRPPPRPVLRAGLAGLPGGSRGRAARAARAGARRAAHVRRVAKERGERQANPTLTPPFQAAPTPAPRAQAWTCWRSCWAAAS